MVGLAAWSTSQGLGAPSPCAGPPTTNAQTTVSRDGSTVYGSECGDRIVVTSPAVEEIVGGNGADVIYANPNVLVVDGGEGDDVIHGELPEGVTESSPVTLRGEELRLGQEPVASASLSEKKCEANVSCYGGIGSQKLVGSGGNDRIFGQRGNDELFGNSGNDRLFGGIGDEGVISGGAGNDLLSGGMGKDYLNGNQDNDMLRADGTTDHIEDASGSDTLSFATAVTPGFNGTVSAPGFPADAPGEERGVAVYLDGAICAESNGIKFQACNNDARYGGGYDEIVVAGIENVIGSPFADVIVGSSGANRIDGGGGADVIYGRGENDTLYGGPDGDFLSGEEGTDTVDGQGGADNCVAETANSCAGSSEAVVQRDRTKISVGLMATNLSGASMNWSEVFMSGSTSADRVKAAFSVVSEVEAVTFTTEGESAKFDISAESTGCTYEATKVVCVLPKPLDAITVAGNAGNDVLTLEPFDETTSPALLGGEGNDELVIGSGTEDMLVDGNGSGADVLKAGPMDDVLINNEGADNVQGGAGNDLLISATVCEGDTLQGASPGEGDGSAQNSSSWAKLVAGSPGVIADLAAAKAGTSWSGSTPACASGTAVTLANIDDLEGSDQADQLYGDKFANNLLGRPGKDELWGREGEDNIEAKDGVNGNPEIAEVGGGGPGTDTCTLDAIDSFGSCNP
jgi:Ca2+-binding RTX toxin-like protein